MLGVKRGTVQLAHNHEEWKRAFETEKRQLQEALDGLALDIQHIGSTAIPGIPAKPILDIVVAIPKLTYVEECVPRLANIGYENRGQKGIPERYLFIRGGEDYRTHHLHVTSPASRFYTDKILFRDYLINHPQVRDEYAQLKRELYSKHAADRESYTTGKSDFIKKVLQLAYEQGQSG